MAPFQALRGDLRIATRVLRRSAGATALSVLSIALGIGLTAGIFSLGDAILLRPMPFHEPARLLQLFSLGDDGQVFQYGWLDYLDLTAAGSGLADFAASQSRGSFLTAGDETELVYTDPVTPNYFSLLGVRAMLGRASVGAAAGRPEAVLGYQLWQRRFGGDAGIAGKTIVLNGRPFVVAGVTPREFGGLQRGMTGDVWVSNDAWMTMLGGRGERASRSGQLDIIARLKPGVTAARAAPQLDAAIRGAGKHKPAPKGAPGTVLQAGFAPNWQSSVIFGGGLLLALSLVLFVACANVAQLRLAQAEWRKRELGVRLALGASGWSLTRQLLVESALISLLGAGLGLLLARVLMEKIAQFVTQAWSFADLGLRLDSRVLAFALFALLLALLISGLAPARHAARLDVSEILKSGQGATGPRGGWRRKLLLAGQVAVSLALFGMAALFLESLHAARALRPGLDPQKRLFTMLVSPGLRMSPDVWAEQACDRLMAVPGTRGAAFARRLPLSGSGGGMTVRVEIPGQAPLGVHLNNVGGNYFALVGTRVLAGRGIDRSDRADSAPVAVLNQTLARQAFPGRNPVGASLRIEGKMRQVIGVAEDGPSNDLHENSEPFLWLPYGQAPWGGEIALLAETAAGPETLARPLRAELKRFDPHAEILVSGSLRQEIEASLAPDRLIVAVTTGLGIFGVLFTAAGLFGVLQYAVSRRTREFGLRIALGARPAGIQRMVLAESVKMAAWGMPAGVLLLAAGARAVASRLLGITPLNPLVYAASAAAVLALTLISAWIPALRATRVDPAAALRSE